MGEHREYKRQIVPFKDYFKDVAVSRSSPCNLCYIPENDNRGKTDKTYYEMKKLI